MSFLKLCLVEAKIIILSDVALNASINRRSDYLYIKSEVNKGTCVELRFLHFTWHGTVSILEIICYVHILQYRVMIKILFEVIH